MFLKLLSKRLKLIADIMLHLKCMLRNFELKNILNGSDFILQFLDAVLCLSNILLIELHLLGKEGLAVELLAGLIKR